MIKIIRKENTNTSKWSGGTTTQLAIYPEDGDYAKREFTWRISSAIVDVEESEFTSLPGISRCLMILEGRLWLKHEGQYECELKRFDQDNFSGSWRTISRGKVTDFNLMTSLGEGRVQVLEIDPGAHINVSLFPVVEEWGKESEAFYILSDAVEVSLPEGKTEVLRRGDVVVVVNCVTDDTRNINITNIASAKAEIVRAVIYHD